VTPCALRRYPSVSRDGLSVDVTCGRRVSPVPTTGPSHAAAAVRPCGRAVSVVSSLVGFSFSLSVSSSFSRCAGECGITCRTGCAIVPSFVQGSAHVNARQPLGSILRVCLFTLERTCSTLKEACHLKHEMHFTYHQSTLRVSFFSTPPQ